MKKVFVLAWIVLLGFVAYVFWDQRKELQAYERINQQGGIVMIAPDGKRFISFRLRVEMATEASPAFQSAMNAMPYIHDLRGVNLDRVKGLQPSHIAPLVQIRTLEQLNACETDLDEKDMAFLMRYGAPGLKVITEYP